ncbi:class I SAM-dependent methyltransferase [Trinickia terrae]|uniref:Class I SAM-dependent methyltransferase n=2 Tax=Trinickia terrae TaxID=2571161 RepID=A0A4U1IFI8_9BURK|nr:class I SAM-dependent methyltransferase [Trinickia terrae]TKC92506.1 class I SAM-dependent methyltransferase [Trinickia terrae]
MDAAGHWEAVYRTKAPDAVSWYRPHLELSLQLIERVAPDRAAAIIDAGGGQASLVDDLLARGYRDVTVLDLSRAALDAAQRRIGGAAARVNWIAGDVTRVALEADRYDVWHDRAVFHFLTEPRQRAAYVRQASRAIRPGGHLIVAAFGPEGPQKCSGLDVVRYDTDALYAQFAANFRLVESATQWHRTPSGATQQFVHCCLERGSQGD